MSPIPAEFILIGVGELTKLAALGIQLYFQAQALAGATEAQIEADFQRAKAEYFALPKPGDIPAPVGG